jgi:hypothetical protein
VYRIPDTALYRQVDQEIVVLEIATSQYHTLNDSAAFAFEHLGAGRSIDETVELMLEEFDVTREQAEKDVPELVDQLISSGLLERIE